MLLYRRNYLSSSFDSESIALFGRMTVAPTDTRKVAINNFIVGVKKDEGISLLSEAFDMLYMLCAPDSQAALLNWVSSSFTITPVNSPTLNPNIGYFGDASTKYLNTNWNQSSDAIRFARDNASLGCYITTNAAEVKYQMGAQSLTTGTGIIAQHTNNNFISFCNSDGAPVVSVPNLKGLSVVQRTSSTLQTAYKDGVAVATETTASKAIAAFQMYLLCYNINGSPGLFSGNTMAHAFAGRAINQTLYYARIQEYMQTLNIAV